MKYKKLFESGNVSAICYGTLALSRLQNNDQDNKKISLLEYAFSKGINFFDTAELYDNYKIIGQFLKNINRNDVFISTKSYAFDKHSAEKSIEKALIEMNTSYIDIFMLHEIDGENNYLGHYEAVKRLLKFKEEGIIKHFGISTHKIKAVEDIIKYREIDIIHPIVNIAGFGIQDGTIENMLKCIKKAKDNSKFILSMKPYGGGHLIKDCRKALDFIKDITCIDSIAIGMKSKEEIDANILYYENKQVPTFISSKLNKQKRRLIISFWCKGCKKCIEKCNHDALKIINGKCEVDINKCALCSYCADVCDEFCIKIV